MELGASVDCGKRVGVGVGCGERVGLGGGGLMEANLATLFLVQDGYRYKKGY